MNARRAVVVYSLIRLGMFVVIFTGVYLLFSLQLDTVAAGLASAVIAAVASFCLSYIFLKRPRDEMAKAIHERRTATGPIAGSDDDVEDAAVDSAR